MAQALVLDAAQSAQIQQQQQQLLQQQRLRMMFGRMRKYRKRIAELQKKILFLRKRASKHDDGYFIFLGCLAAIVDFLDTFDIISVAIVGLFTFWVPLALTALFRWGPRHYVWQENTNAVILTISQISFKFIPWVRTLPLNVSKVCQCWNLSFIHKENDLIRAKILEKELNRLIRNLKRGKL